MRQFAEYQGPVVLADTILKMTPRNGQTTINHEMEYKLLSCLKQSLTMKVGPKP